MAEQSAALNRHDLEAKIVKRCWEDEAFRKEFTADPGAAFVKYLQVPAKSLPKIAVLQESQGSWHIVIPAKPANASELSEADLEKVAGGVTPVTVALTVSASLIASGGAAVSAGGVTASMVVSEKYGGW